MLDASWRLLAVITAGVVIVAIAVCIHLLRVAAHTLDLGEPDEWYT